MEMVRYHDKSLFLLLVTSGYVILVAAVGIDNLLNDSAFCIKDVGDCFGVEAFPSPQYAVNDSILDLHITTSDVHKTATFVIRLPSAMGVGEQLANAFHKPRSSAFKSGDLAGCASMVMISD